MTTALRHIALFVHNLQAAEAYYRRLFAMEIVSREARMEDGLWYALPAGKGWSDARAAGVELGMLALRQQLADELRRLTNSDRFDFIARHRGMFSRLGATPGQVEEMRSRYGIYMIGDSRINVAGLNAETVPVLAKAIVSAGV